MQNVAVRTISDRERAWLMSLREVNLVTPSLSDRPYPARWAGIFLSVP